MKNPLLCTNCGFVGFPKKRIPGSIWITLILLCFFFLPGIIYEIWRNNATKLVCESCGGSNLIPVDSPTGVKILESQGKTTAPVEASFSLNNKDHDTSRVENLLAWAKKHPVAPFAVSGFLLVALIIGSLNGAPGIGTAQGSVVGADVSKQPTSYLHTVNTSVLPHIPLILADFKTALAARNRELIQLNAYLNNHDVSSKDNSDAQIAQNALNDAGGEIAAAKTTLVSIQPPPTNMTRLNQLVSDVFYVLGEAADTISRDNGTSASPFLNQATIDIQKITVEMKSVGAS